MIGLVMTGVGSDRILKLTAANGVTKPEYRLPPMIPAALLVPFGFYIRLDDVLRSSMNSSNYRHSACWHGPDWNLCKLGPRKPVQ
jgi:hypothetical protein